MKVETREEEAVRMWQQEHPQFLGKLACDHIAPFVKKPIIGWEEWCDTCQDFMKVVDGVSLHDAIPWLHMSKEGARAGTTEHEPVSLPDVPLSTQEELF